MTFARRVCVVVGITALGFVLLMLLWYAAEVLLLVFAAVLMATLLRGLSGLLESRAGWKPSWALTAVIATLALTAGLLGWFFAERIAWQIDELSSGIVKSAERFGVVFSKYGWGKRLLGHAPDFGELTQRANLVSRVTGLFSATLTIAIDVTIVTFVGIYFAVDPVRYREGIISLFPKPRRQRLREVLAEVGATLQRWLAGRSILMVSNGLLTAAGLWLLGVPMPLTLGAIAGLLNFVPNVGPIVASVPAVLIGWTEGRAIAVAVLYFTLQMADGYIFTPLVQQRTVALPAALIIIAQLLAGVLAGMLGVLLATPLAAATVILVRRLYIEDVLEAAERVHLETTASGSTP